MKKKGKHAKPDPLWKPTDRYVRNIDIRSQIKGIWHRLEAKHG